MQFVIHIFSIYRKNNLDRSFLFHITEKRSEHARTSKSLLVSSPHLIEISNLLAPV